MAGRRVLVAIAMSLMMTQLTLAGVAEPTLFVVSPAPGAVLKSHMVRINGTATGSDAQWFETSDTDFRAGNTSGVVALWGHVWLAENVYDNFDDGAVNTTRWTTAEANGMHVTETVGALRLSGAYGGPADDWTAIAEATSTSSSAATVSANLSSLSASVGWRTHVALVDPSTGDMIALGQTLDQRLGSSPVIHTVMIVGGIRSDRSLGNATAGKHSYKIVYKTGSASLFQDGKFLSSDNLTLGGCQVVLSAALWRSNCGCSITAEWDDVKTGYVTSGTFTSAAFDTSDAAPEVKQVDWSANEPKDTRVTMELRSSSTADMSSPTAWAEVYNGRPSYLPPLRRYLQYRATLASTNGVDTPYLLDVTVAYFNPIRKVEVSIDGKNSWLEATGKESWEITVELPENATEICVQVTDGAGGTRQAYRTVNIDTTPPAGTLVINGGDRYTTEPLVTLMLDAFDSNGVSSVLLGENPDLQGMAWQKYDPFVPWTLSRGDGLKKVFARFRDVNGWESTIVSDSILLDTRPPGGSFTINNGAEFTSDTCVKLTLNGTDSAGVAKVLISNKEDFSDGMDWTPYGPQINWTLLPGSGERTVYLRFCDMALHESDTLCDAIILDAEGPYLEVTINSGAAFAAFRNVTLNLTATDNYRVECVEVSESALFTDTPRRSFAPQLDFRLSATDGPKTIYARAVDAAGNTGQVNVSSITLDTTPPESGIGQLPSYVENPNIRVNWRGSDAASGVRWFDLQYKNDSGPWTDWLLHTFWGSSYFKGQEGHEYHFRVRAQDYAGNEQVYPDEGSGPVSVRTWHVPVISIESPGDGAHVRGAVTISGKAHQPDEHRSIRVVEVSVDGGDWMAAQGTTGWEYRLDLAGLDSGTHKIEVRASDGERYSDVAELNFTVEPAPGTGGAPFPTMLVLILMVFVAAVASGAFFWTRKRPRGDVSGTGTGDQPQQCQPQMDHQPAPQLAADQAAVPAPPRKKVPQEILADETAFLEGRILKALSSIPHGLPSSLDGLDVDELVEKVVSAEQRETPAGELLVKIDNIWYYGDERNPGTFMQRYKE